MDKGGAKAERGYPGPTQGEIRVKHSSVRQCICLECWRPFQTIALTCTGPLLL